MMDFSVIIPSYNNLELFSNALRSVLCQKKVHFEIIIVDDSTDYIIDNYVKSISNNTIRYYHNIPSLGAVANWNFGLTLAYGKYISILHHDEEYSDPYHLFNCIKKLNDNYDVIISTVLVGINGSDYEKLRYPFMINNIIISKIPSLLFLINIIGPVSCVSFKRTSFVFFDEQLHWFVDVEWYYRLMKNKKRFILKKQYVNSNHGHKFQITKNINTKKSIKDDTDFIVKKYGLFKLISFFLILHKYIDLLFH
jgi:glycosyltransferase involved in cell wall biosynthesis